MKPITDLIRLAFIFGILLQSCSSKKTEIVDEKDSIIQTVSQTKSENLNAKWKRIDEVNDSIGQELFKKFPNALNTDSLNYSYSIFLQKGLKKSNNLIFISVAFINDIREYKGNYLITTYSYFPKIITNLFLESRLAEDLLEKIEKGNTYESCCLIANIRKFVPVTTDLITEVDEFSLEPEENNVTEEDIKDNIQLAFGPGFSPTYFMTGSILEIRIFK